MPLGGFLKRKRKKQKKRKRRETPRRGPGRGLAVGGRCRGPGLAAPPLGPARPPRLPTRGSDGRGACQPGRAASAACCNQQAVRRADRHIQRAIAAMKARVGTTSHPHRAQVKGQRPGPLFLYLLEFKQRLGRSHAMQLVIELAMGKIRQAALDAKASPGWRYLKCLRACRRRGRCSAAHSGG